MLQCLQMHAHWLATIQLGENAAHLLFPGYPGEISINPLWKDIQFSSSWQIADLANIDLSLNLLLFQLLHFLFSSENWTYLPSYNTCEQLYFGFWVSTIISKRRLWWKESNIPRNVPMAHLRLLAVINPFPNSLFQVFNCCGIHHCHIFIERKNINACSCLFLSNTTRNKVCN